MLVVILPASRITVAIADPEFATLMIWRPFVWEEVEVTYIPADVVQGCLAIERKIQKQKRE